MTDKEKSALIVKAIQHFGAYNQILKSIEEFSELSASLARYACALDEQLNLPREQYLVDALGEMADAQIMLVQLSIILGDTTPMVEQKLERLKNTIESDETMTLDFTIENMEQFREFAQTGLGCVISKNSSSSLIAEITVNTKLTTIVFDFGTGNIVVDSEEIPVTSFQASKGVVVFENADSKMTYRVTSILGGLLYEGSTN